MVPAIFSVTIPRICAIMVCSLLTYSPPESIVAILGALPDAVSINRRRGRCWCCVTTSVAGIAAVTSTSVTSCAIARAGTSIASTVGTVSAGCTIGAAVIISSVI